MYEIEQHQGYYVVKDKEKSLYVSGYTQNHGYKLVTDYTYAKKYTEGTAICHMNALNALKKKGE